MQNLSELLLFVLPVHPLWLHKVKDVKDPGKWCRHAREYPLDATNRPHIMKLIELRDVLFESCVGFHCQLSFSQFYNLAPLFLHQYIVLNKYYRLQTQQLAYSNTLACRVAGCEHSLVICIDFHNKQLSLTVKGLHNHNIKKLDKFPSGFIKGVVESYALLGFSSPKILLEAIKDTLVTDLPAVEKENYYDIIGLNNITTAFSANAIKRVQDEQVKSLGQEYQDQIAGKNTNRNNKRNKIQSMENSWQVTTFQTHL